MGFKDLLKFIDIESERLKKRFGGYNDEEKRLLARTVKLSEEVGELCDAILTRCSMSREDKMEKSTEDDLPNEIADVLITTLLVAKVAEVDVVDALNKKINKINSSYE